MNKKKIKYLIIAGLVIVLAVIVAVKLWSQKFVQPNKYQSGKITRTQVAESNLPDKYPTNFPAEDKVQVVQNENVKIDNAGEQILQGRRQFISEKSLAENLGLYQQYLKDNQWGIISVIDESDIKAVVGRKFSEGMSMSINLSKMSDGKTLVNTVVEYK